jgi:hypothetical protein
VKRNDVWQSRLDRAFPTLATSPVRLDRAAADLLLVAGNVCWRRSFSRALECPKRDFFLRSLKCSTQLLTRQFHAAKTNTTTQNVINNHGRRPAITASFIDFLGFQT